MAHFIRALYASDARDFKDLRLQSLQLDPLSWHSSFEEEGNLSENFFGNKITSSVYLPIFGYYGYFEDEKLFAYAQISTSFYRKKKHIATIYDVVVSPEARRKSVGTKLISFIIKKAKSTRYIEQIHLKVNSKNRGAIKFYEKLGFKKASTLKKAVREKDGTYQDEYEYVLNI